MKTISRIQYITTNATLAELACKGGINWVQLRLKNTPYEQFLQTAKEVQQVCKQYNATLIINDNVAIAKEIRAHGVHLGKTDMLPELAREILGANAIIGCTANIRGQIIKLADKPIDYIGLGPFRFTPTKEKLSALLGFNGYKRILKSLQEKSIKDIPIIAIGGITEYDIKALMATGIYGIAVSGAISNDDDVTNSAKRFNAEMNKYLAIEKLKKENGI